MHYSPVTGSCFYYYVCKFLRLGKSSLHKYSIFKRLCLRRDPHNSCRYLRILFG